MADELYKEFGDLLRQKRVAAGLTQEELAVCLGLGRTSVTNIEKGRQPITLAVLYDLARALEVPPTELLPPERIPILSPEVEHKVSEFTADIQSDVRRFLSRN
jgi:transcriptional regulator with XRE-family HTH domain